MGIVHIPRTLAAICRGKIKRWLSPLADKEKALVGLGLRQPPHVYTSRAGLFDVDLMLHMNNASYLTHNELARWEWSGFTGSLDAGLKSKSSFILTATMLRFRREIPPLKKFNIETRLVSMDNRNIYFYQTFHEAKKEKSKVLAQVLSQAVIVVGGKKVATPRLWLEENFPAATEEILDDLTSSAVPGSLHGDKATRFKHLEEIMKESAAQHDEGVEQ